MNFKFLKPKVLLIIAGILFLTAVVLTGGYFAKNKQSIVNKAAASTILSISPKTLNTSQSKNVVFTVNMDTGTNNVTGLDVGLKFDPSVFHVNSIEKGSGISSFDNVLANTFDNSTGVVAYTAFTLDKNLAVKGASLEVIKINAKTISNAPVGSSLFSFDSTSAVSATNESQNALTETAPGTIIITSSTPSPSPSPAPGEPNSCNGTCGSNNNCKAGLFCYQGYCRNPNCKTNSDCNCVSATNSPSPSPVSKKTATPTAKPQVTTAPVVVNTSSNPTATPSSFWQNVFSNATNAPVAEATISPIDLPESKSSSVLPWIIGSLVAVGLILIVIVVRILKNDGIHKTLPPVIKL